MGRLLLLAAAALCAAAATPAAAQVSAQVVPVKCTLSGRPGEVIEREIFVQNAGDQEVVVHTTVADWTLGPRGELQLLPAGSGPRSLAGLVRCEPESYSLPAHASRAVRLTARVPADGPVARWGVVLSQLRPVSPRRTALGPTAVAELGTTVYLNREPGGVPRAEIVAMSVARARHDSLRVEARLRGVGELPLYFHARLSVLDGAGRAGVSLELPTTLLLPAGDRLVECTLPAPASPGVCRATCTVDTGEPALLVGELPFSWPPAASPPLAGPLPR